jgi:asparagine synthase (glutamine-hydrolysing)
MAVGVEARVPFLDFDLVRVMNSIPSKVKLKRGVPKYVLKRAMEPYLPHEIVYREKASFGLPIRSWMKDDSEILRHCFDKERIRRQGIFNPIALKTMCEEQFSGKNDHSSVLFSMLCIQIWLDSQGSV